MANVSYRNFDRAFLFGLKEGVAKYSNVVIGRGGEQTKIFACAGDYSYEAGSQLTPATFLFAATVLHNYVKAVTEGKATQKRLMLVLPDDCAIRHFEIRKAMQSLLDDDRTDSMEFDEIVDAIAAPAIKSWMNEAWAQAVTAFAHAYTEAVGEGIEIGVMKHTNLYAWEIRSDVKDAVFPLKAGDKVNVKDGVIEGVESFKVENNRVSGEGLEISSRTFGNSDNDRQITRYYVPRMGEGIDISNLRKADSVLRQALPHREEGIVCEAAEF